MFDLTLCFHSLGILNNFWTSRPKFSFISGRASYGGRPAEEAGRGSDVAHGGAVQGQERVDMKGDGEDEVTNEKKYTYTYVCVL